MTRTDLGNDSMGNNVTVVYTVTANEKQPRQDARSRAASSEATLGGGPCQGSNSETRRMAAQGTLKSLVQRLFEGYLMDADSSR